MKYHFFAYLFLICSTLSAQINHSKFEESVFDGFKKDSINYDFFSSLLAIDSLVTNEISKNYKARVDTFIQAIPKKEEKDKKEKKRIKKIYDDLHDTFFKKYQLEAYFNDIFKYGHYNCVTASALYVYVFDKIGVPYHIKETPSHVFLVAYPNSLNIHLETTVPGAYGFLIPKENEIKDIIDELISVKLVTREEVMEKGYMDFYKDYFYGKENIDKKSLIGMQYYNKGVFALDRDENNSAYNNLEKAKLFYNSPLIEPLLKGLMFTKVNNLEYNTETDIRFLIKTLNLSNYPEDYSIGNVKSSLSKIIDHDDNDVSFIEYVANSFNALNEEEVKKEAKEFLYEFLAEEAAREEDIDLALQYGDLLLSENPKNKTGKKVVEYISFKKIGLSRIDEPTLNTLNQLADKYPFIKENNRYDICLAHLYANISLENFRSKKIEKAENYLKKLETLLDEKNIIEDINKILLEMVYQRAGNYYYYKSQYHISYKIYLKGLTYSPNNSELKKYAKWSKEEM